METSFHYGRRVYESIGDISLSYASSKFDGKKNPGTSGLI